ncbi:MAG: SPOR domain-containing protein [Candidatus Rokuibacteriota bacterium]
MWTLARRYAHVPLGIVSLLLVVAIIAWLLERRVDGIWEPALLIAAPIPPVVSIASPGLSRSDPPVPDSARGLREPTATSPPPGYAARTERYALESGPFRSAETADQREDELNRLGFATIRFRKQDVTRLYVIAATGFATVPDAERATVELGGGTVAQADHGTEVVLHRVASLHEAVAAARSLRDRGFEARVGEEASPTVIYHIRYGQFTNQAAAHARSQEMAQLGLSNRVLKVR